MSDHEHTCRWVKPPPECAACDHEVFVAKVRQAIEADLMAENSTIADSFTTVRREDKHVYFIEGEIDTTALAKAAIEAMVEHMGPPW